MVEEMKKLRKMLSDKNIEWTDDSDSCTHAFRIDRTHFSYRGFDWSVIHGFGTYGGWNRMKSDDKLLELMSNAVNDGIPVGYLTAEEAMALVEGD